MEAVLCIVGCLVASLPVTLPPHNPPNPHNKLRLLYLPWWLRGKASACNVGNLGLIPGSAISPGEGNGNPFQYSCLENAMDRGAWWATVHGVAKSRTRLSDLTVSFLYLLHGQAGSLPLHHLESPKNHLQTLLNVP